MGKKARMALEEVCEKEVAGQRVQVQGCREFPPPEEFAARHPADLLLSGSVSQLVSFMQAIADRFTANIQAASQELMIRVENSSSFNVSSSPAPAESSWTSIQSAKLLFEKRVQEATNQMEAHRQWLADEFRNLDSHWYGNVLTRAVQSEADIGSEVLASQSMLQDQSVDLSLVMRALAVQNQRRAYLKRLKLQIQD